MPGRCHGPFSGIDDAELSCQLLQCSAVGLEAGVPLAIVEEAERTNRAPAGDGRAEAVGADAGCAVETPTRSPAPSLTVGTGTLCRSIVKNNA